VLEAEDYWVSGEGGERRVEFLMGVSKAVVYQLVAVDSGDIE
jgi:hypothetical protein